MEDDAWFLLIVPHVKWGSVEGMSPQNSSTFNILSSVIQARILNTNNWKKNFSGD